MSKRKEKISAFLDNDMHRDELMSFSLSAEANDAKVAQRYQMLGDALRGKMSDSSFVDVSHVVREALAGENLASESGADQMSATKQKPSSLEQLSKPGFFDLSAWFKPVAGMAVAASVAVVMVVSVNQQNDAGVTPVAAQLEAQPAVQLAVDETINNKAVDNKSAELDSYINQHLEFAAQDALQGRLPYVRAVSFEPEK
jgi:negative regulator of sigma E activity